LAERGDTILLVPQVVFEFWVVATRPPDVNGFGWNPEATHATLEQLRQRLPVLEERPDVFERWLDLVVHRGVRGKGAHDARLAVTMKSLGIDRILTFNVADFKSLGAPAIHPVDCQ
jgi:predicted nucleic acid-binding protein